MEDVRGGRRIHNRDFSSLSSVLFSVSASSFSSFRCLLLSTLFSHSFSHSLPICTMKLSLLSGAALIGSALAVDPIVIKVCYLRDMV